MRRQYDFSNGVRGRYRKRAVTDESELRDFITDETPSDFASRFKSRYDLELSEDDNVRIVELSRRTAEHQRATPEGN